VTKQDRAEIANKIIRIIASHGRRFYSMNSDRRVPLPESENRISRFEVDRRGRVWFIDKYTQKRIYVAYEYWKRGFSDGGTLRDVVVMLRDYITGKRPEVQMGRFGPYPEWACGGDPWGYGREEMALMRQEIAALLAEATNV
jgi:hypothetical protein